MKAKITKKDGTIIELEGSAAELTPIIEREQALKLPATPFPGVATEGLGKRLEEMLKAPPQWAESTWTFTNDMCPMGGAHAYPLVWNSISPAPCSKCGKSALAPAFTLTQATDAKAPIPFVSGFSVVSSERQSLPAEELSKS